MRSILRQVLNHNLKQTLRISYPAFVLRSWTRAGTVADVLVLWAYF